MKFYVGQRVRLKKALHAAYQKYIGEIFIIVSPLCWCEVHTPSMEGYWGYFIQHESWDSPVNPETKHKVHPPPEYLEPLYDGNQVVSWDTCAWRPTDALRTTALRE